MGHSVAPRNGAESESVPEGSTVAILVVTYNSAGDIEAFLDAALAGAGPSCRIVVADNDSGDGTKELVRRAAARQPVQLVELDDNRGYAAGLNAAMNVAGHADHYVVANPDTRIDASCLSAMITAAQGTDVGVVVPKLVDERGALQPSLRRDPTVRRAFAEAVLGGARASRLGWGEVVSSPEAYERAHDAEWATGALLLVTHACVQRVGPWDESFFLYSEETDYLLRTRDAGLRVRFEPDAVASHRGGHAHQDADLWSLLTGNRVRLYARRHGRPRADAFWLAVLVNELLRSVTGRTHRRAVARLLRERRRLLRGAPIGLDRR